MLVACTAKSSLQDSSTLISTQTQIPTETIIPVCTPTTTLSPIPFVPYISNGFIETYQNINNQLVLTIATGDNTVIYHLIQIGDYESDKYIIRFDIYPEEPQYMWTWTYQYQQSPYKLTDAIEKILRLYSYGDGGLDNYPSDPQEIRDKISSVLRIYINEELIQGQLQTIVDQGTYYYFVLDKPYKLSEVKTLRIELGFKDK